MSLPGFHFAPVRKSSRPISFMAGTPFANRKIQMSTTAKMEVSAQRKNTMCIMFSRKFFINLSPIQAQGERFALFYQSVNSLTRGRPSR